MKVKSIVAATILAHASIHAMEKKQQRQSLQIAVHLGKCVNRVMQQENLQESLRKFALTLVSKLKAAHPSPYHDLIPIIKDREKVIAYLSSLPSQQARLSALKKIIRYREADTFDSLPAGFENMHGFEKRLHDPVCEELIGVEFLKPSDAIAFLDSIKIYQTKVAYQAFKTDFENNSAPILFRDPNSFCHLHLIKKCEKIFRYMYATPFIAKFGDLFLKHTHNAQEVHAVGCSCKGSSLLCTIAQINGKMLQYIVEKLREKSVVINYTAPGYDNGYTLIDCVSVLDRQADALQLFIEDGNRISNWPDGVKYRSGTAGVETNIIYRLCSKYPDEEIVTAAQQTYNELFPEVK